MLKYRWPCMDEKGDAIGYKNEGRGSKKRKTKKRKAASLVGKMFAKCLYSKVRV